MLERYFVRPDLVDRIRSAWIGATIEKYVEWLTEQGYAARTVLRRVPLLMEFGGFARQHGVTTLEELPSQVEGFALHWLEKHGQRCKTDQTRAKVKEEARNPVDQMLALVFRVFRIRVGRGGASHFKMQSRVSSIICARSEG